MSPSNAEAHIAKIRHDKGLSENNFSSHNVSDLESALTTLSEQLYQSSTRFLLELLQNADDNSYDPKVEPSVEFTYLNGCLRVDCNEVGFSARNVEALCRVGQSTKKNESSARTYVGEKGIGFKSVFKAADIVWVSSGDYSFKFDKNKQLGMIAPIWAEFPVPVKPGLTSIYLQLSQNYNRSGLVNELRSLDSRLLIFLRRLRNITVSIFELGPKVWKRSFSRSEIGKDLVRLVENNKPCDYIIKRHQVSSMPREPKRQGVSSTEIILGFPITEENEPKRESQRAYAFLPIRDYGFEFLIQADFLLIASREDIDESSEWNRTIRKALSIAFVDTIKSFNKGQLQYLWPRYLPNREPLQSFLKPFHLDLIAQLTSQPILFSRTGELASPKDLTYVPEKFTFNGDPLTLSTTTSQGYLSTYYSQSDMEYLKVLGVGMMSEDTFLPKLISMLQNAKNDFTTKSNAWHSYLANVLIGLPQSAWPLLPTLEIVPLNDGSWVAAKGRHIVFPAHMDQFELPGGLDLAVVHPDAVTDPERQKLFKVLGVGDIQQGPIVQRIADLHENGLSNSVSCAALVSQIQFLYSAGWKNPKFQGFWFTSENGQKFHGSNLYQDSQKPHSATKFFGAHRNKFRFIHKDYLEAESQDQDSWGKWLEQKMEVATMPRLVQSTQTGGFRISEDFEFIIKNFPSSDILLLLRDNWEEYSKFLSADYREKCHMEDKIFQYDAKRFPACAARLKTRLGSMLVTCKTGKKHRLDETFLPSKEILVAAQKGMQFVDVPDANNSSWRVMMEALGVSIKVDISFYLRCLETLALAGSDNTTQVMKLLRSIQVGCHDEAEASKTKDFFGNKKMVYIPAETSYGQRHKWITLSQCRWKGPRGLKTFDTLRDVYSLNERLFCEILDVRDATLQDLSDETKSFSIGDSLKHITNIFHSMEKLVEESNSISTAIEHCKLPVSKNWSHDKGLVIGLEDSSNSAVEWFIADTAPFRTIFAGIVPLLDIQVDDLAAMKEVLNKLGLKNRFLSQMARSVPRTQGVIEFNQELTDAYRKKVNFIIRLIPTSKDYRKRRQEVIEQLQNLQVYTADEVIQEWSVSYKGKLIKGPPGNGRAALVAEKNVLKIYLAAKDDFGEEQTPMELVDELFNFCGMIPNEPQHSEMCLHVALSQSNIARVSKVFSDKGIPSLESLKFADEIEIDESKDVEKFPLDAKNSESYIFGVDEQEKKSRTSGGKFAAQVALGVICFPICLPAIGLNELFKKKKYFDGTDDEDDATPEEAAVEVAIVEPTVKAPEISTPTIQQKNKGKSPKFWLRLFSTDENIAFKGELAVHQVLKETLGANYNPVLHWNSKHRSKAKIAKLVSNETEQYSTFKFSDLNGAFSQFLSKENPAAKNWLAKPPTYHIDVKSTMGDIHTKFSVSPIQFRRARDLSVMMQQMNGDVDSTPNDVYILVRVYDVGVMADDDGKGMKMVFVVDPWESYHKDRLVMKPKGKLAGSIV